MAKDLYLSEGRVMGPDGQLDLATAFPNDPVVNATFAASTSNVVGIIGDSIAASSTGGRWLNELTLRAAGRVVEQVNVGVGGNTSTQMLARIQTDILDLPLPPDWVIIQGVTPNDPSASISLATAKANIVEMVTKVEVAGLRPVLVSGPPSDNTTYRDFMLNMNAWLTRWAQGRGLAVLDLYTPTADPADGTFATAMTTDGTHFSVAGAQAAAQAIIDSGALPADMRPTSRWMTAKNDPSNLLLNGGFVGDANSDGIADSWYIISGLATRSLVARSGGLGNWQQVTSAGGATEYFASNNVTTGYAAGDLIEFTAEIQVTAAGATTKLVVRPVHSTSTSLAVDWSHEGSTTPTDVAVPILRRFTVPAEATNLALRVLLSGDAGTVRVGRAAYRNLTALGLTG